MSVIFRFKVIACLLLILVFPAAIMAQQPTIISATPSRLLLDGWEMVLPEIEGPYNKNPKMTVLKYTLNGEEKRFAMVLPPDVPIKWAKRNVNRKYEFMDSPTGYSPHYAKELNDWWINGGRGNYRFVDGKWVSLSGSASSAVPPAPESVNPTPQQTMGQNTGSPSQSSGNSTVTQPTQPGNSAIRTEYLEAKKTYDDSRAHPEKYPNDLQKIYTRFQKANDAYMKELSK